MNVKGLPDKVNSRDIVLITYYNRCHSDTPCWEVYGHEETDVNYLLASFPLKSQAIEYAHNCTTLPVPVMHCSDRHKCNKIIESVEDLNLL